MSDASLSSAYRRLRIPDEERYWVEQVKCRVGCPVFTDACGYVTAVSEGRDEDAYRIARATNPFVSICGRICGAPCEKACRRGSVDAPVSIRAIKRFATEQFGTDLMELPHAAFLRAFIAKRWALVKHLERQLLLQTI